MSLSTAARHLGLGRLALSLCHRPLARARQCLRNGGPLAEIQTERRRRHMEEYATRLTALPDFPGAAPLRVHLMTGRRFWYQTVFCLASLSRSAQATLDVDLYDDGTLDTVCASRLARLGSRIRIHSAGQLNDRLEQLLPRARFPQLRNRWDHYPNIRKLIDVHLGTAGWKLVLDSDLLFFRRPEALLSWNAAPTALLHAIDCDESYGYSRPILERLAGGPLPVRLNVGVCGLRSESIDWEQLEAWIAELHRNEPFSYYLEQALVAMLAARQPTVGLPAQDYVTMPTKPEVLAPRAVMHHYVADSKRWYFNHGWQHLVNGSRDEAHCGNNAGTPPK